MAEIYFMLSIQEFLKAEAGFVGLGSDVCIYTGFCIDIKNAMYLQFAYPKYI